MLNLIENRREKIKLALLNFQLNIKDKMPNVNKKDTKFLFKLTLLFHKYGYGLDEEGYIYILDRLDRYTDNLKVFTINKDSKLIFEAI